jgi:hypothetical protein
MPQGSHLSLSSRLSRATPLLILAAAIVLAAGVYGSFLRVHRSLWDNPIHDRNAHYLFSLRLADDVRSGHLLQLLVHLNQAGVWPPLHHVLTTGVLLVGGSDYRLAVLPNLAAWVATIVLAFLIGRRAAGVQGTFAGLVAAVFVAASPAHRAFATDIMLESLGACLTLAALYCYLAAVQGPAPPAEAGRRLALALTALFFCKYNYWALVVFALCLNEGLARRRELPGYFRSLFSFPMLRRWCAAQPRQPTTWALAVLIGLVVAVVLRGQRPLTLGAFSVSLYPPNNLLTIVAMLVMLRLWAWWRRTGREQAARLDPRLHALIVWHAWPAAIWLLLPGHLGGFLWYLSPANADPEQRVSVWAALGDYGRWLTEDYHASVTLTLVAGALCLLGLASARRSARGGGAVLVLTVLAATLTVLHPNHKARCLHSWIVAAWISGGMGLAAILDRIRDARLPLLRPLAAAAVLAQLILAQGPALWQPGHSLEAGPRPDHPTLLDVADSYVPDLLASRRATVLAAVPVRTLTQWTSLECGSADRLEEHWYGFGGDGTDDAQRFRHWIETTACDTIVVINGLPGKPLWEGGPECDRVARLVEVLPAQDVFHLSREQNFPQVRYRVQVWQRGVASSASLRVKGNAAPGAPGQ